MDNICIFKGDMEKERLDCHKEIRKSWKKQIGGSLARLEVDMGRTHTCQRSLLNAIQNLVNYCLEQGHDPKEIATKCLTGITCEKISPRHLSCIDNIGRLMGLEEEKNV